ncbi:30S ribosomal protein S4 [archaeon]|jgi:small subunit ribosomal protein S4|nr:30S ribosomal protein S4 [archaeon]
MGQTKRQGKQYSTPSHPWQKERIVEEKELTKEYGLKNKQEIWRGIAKLRKVTTQVKKIIAAKNFTQANLEKDNLLASLTKYNLIGKDAKIEDILDLTSKDFLDRRLQTQVHKKKIANTANQARQMIVHGHIMINNKKVTIPSYMVSANEESQIALKPSSTFARIVEEKPIENTKEIKKETKVKVESKSEEKPVKEELKTTETKEEVKVESKSEEKPVKKEKENGTE